FISWQWLRWGFGGGDLRMREGYSCLWMSNLQLPGHRPLFASLSVELSALTVRRVKRSTLRMFDTEESSETPIYIQKNVPLHFIDESEGSLWIGIIEYI